MISRIASNSRRVLCAAAVAVVVLGSGGERASAAPIAKASADVRVPGPAIPKSYVGFSQEFYLVTSDVGMYAVNPIYAQLFNNIRATGAGAPVLRVGGGSQDSTWWNPARVPLPNGLDQDLDPPFMAAIKRFLDATGSRAIIGLNMAYNRPDLAAIVAQETQKALPGKVIAYELGNEPEFYPERPLGKNKDGSTRFARPKDYSFGDYLREFDAYVDALRRVKPKPRVAASGYCCTPWSEGARLLRRERSRIDEMSVHRYPLSSCFKKPSDPGYPNIGILFQEDVRIGTLTPLIEPIAKARKQGIGVRLTETNSVACSGAEGVSDTFAAALWSLDWMALHAVIGVKGVNFHSGSPAYTPVSHGATPEGVRAIVRPLYFGMLAFSEFAANGARLLPTTYYGTELDGANVQIWGAVDRVKKQVRVMLIHRGGKHGTVSLRVPFAKGPGRIKRLQAPKLDSTRGVTWGGQGFAYPTADGKLTGRLRTETARRRGKDTFLLHMPRYSAAILSVPVSKTR